MAELHVIAGGNGKGDGSSFEDAAPGLAALTVADDAIITLYPDNGPIYNTKASAGASPVRNAALSSDAHRLTIRTHPQANERAVLVDSLRLRADQWAAVSGDVYVTDQLPQHTLPGALTPLAVFFDYDSNISAAGIRFGALHEADDYADLLATEGSYFYDAAGEELLGALFVHLPSGAPDPSASAQDAMRISVSFVEGSTINLTSATGEHLLEHFEVRLSVDDSDTSSSTVRVLGGAGTIARGLVVEGWGYHPISFAGNAGDDMVIEDCVWKDGSLTGNGSGTVQYSGLSEMVSGRVVRRCEGHKVGILDWQGDPFGGNPGAPFLCHASSSGGFDDIHFYDNLIVGHDGFPGFGLSIRDIKQTLNGAADTFENHPARVERCRFVNTGGVRFVGRGRTMVRRCNIDARNTFNDPTAGPLCVFGQDANADSGQLIHVRAESCVIVGASVNRTGAGILRTSGGDLRMDHCLVVDVGVGPQFFLCSPGDGTAQLTMHANVFVNASTNTTKPFKFRSGTTAGDAWSITSNVSMTNNWYFDFAEATNRAVDNTFAEFQTRVETTSQTLVGVDPQLVGEGVDTRPAPGGTLRTARLDGVPSGGGPRGVNMRRYSRHRGAHQWGGGDRGRGRSRAEVVSMLTEGTL